MDVHNITDVFTPTMPASLTFVERASVNEKLVRSLRTPGKQIVVYGHSGSGKTTLLVNKICQLYERDVTTRCMKDLTFDQLILDAFDQMDPFFETGHVEKSKTRKTASIHAEYLGIKARLAESRSQEKETIHQRMLPPQLTPHKLARFMGTARCCWILEDFHKIAQSERMKLSQGMKIFMDTALHFKEVKIIVIGAVGTARQVVACDDEMRQRVAEIHVPLMEDDEILQILTRGEQLLNISFSPEIKAQIVRYSNGLAAVCHQLALNACDAASIGGTLDKQSRIRANHFEKALRNYIEDESDTVKTLFHRALQKKGRGRFDNCRLILKTLAKSDNEDGLTKSEMSKELRKMEPTYLRPNLTPYLGQLQSDERGEILRYDEVSRRYSFGNPFHKAYARTVFENPEAVTQPSVTQDEEVDKILQYIRIKGVFPAEFLEDIHRLGRSMERRGDDFVDW